MSVGRASQDVIVSIASFEVASEARCLSVIDGVDGLGPKARISESRSWVSAVIRLEGSKGKELWEVVRRLRMVALRWVAEEVIHCA